MNLKFLTFTICILVLGISTCNASNRIQDNYTSQPSKQSKKIRDEIFRMEQIVQYYVINKQFMGAILVAQNGQVLLDKGYGYANVEWQIPNSPKTKFRLGSITKQFTAASILLLEEHGKLKTEDLIKKYMVDAPATWDKITIYNLLVHTSGIPNFTDFPDYSLNEAMPTTPEKLVARFQDKPLDFQPGEKWNYSNSGYALLGLLIEKISGQSYKQFVQENIFKTLGMNNSGYDSNTTIIPYRAFGYTLGPNGLENSAYIDMSIPFSAGALYSTTHDLLKWEQRLFAGKLLSAASLRKMTTPSKENANYAYGLEVGIANGHTDIEHAGDINGFSNEMAYYPDDKLTIIVLGNMTGGVSPEQIAKQLASIFHGGKIVLPSERKRITVSRDILAKYIGTYVIGPKVSIVITIENGQLMAQATNELKSPLFAESETKFFPKVVDGELEFFKNNKGEVTHLVLHQSGRDRTGIKK